ncbi:MAG: hypothetical protein ABWZ52_06500 [Acidimicrobiales bacterium]
MTDVGTARSSLLEGVPRRALGGVMVAIVLWTTNVFFVRQADDILVFTTWRMLFAIPVLGMTAAVLRLRPASPVPVARTPLSRTVQMTS